MKEAVYSKFTVDLTSADSLIVTQQSGLIRLLRAVDSAGATVLTALVNVKMGPRDNETLPMALGQAVRYGYASQVTLSWEAQSGVFATFLLSPNPDNFDMDASPPVTLVTGDLASSITPAQVTVTTSATLIKAADASRKSVTVQNVGSADVFLGGSGVATGDGYKLAAGSAFTFSGTSAAIYGIVASGTCDVHVISEG